MKKPGAVSRPGFSFDSSLAVIASEAKQSSAAHSALDCFVLLRYARNDPDCRAELAAQTKTPTQVSPESARSS
jgi:hypothetical protein